MGFSLPSNDERVSILGHTGSGKTQFGAWLLSYYDFDLYPFVIVDFKHDELLNSIEGIKEIGYKDKFNKPGLYIIHPSPDEDEEMEHFLWKIHTQQRTGLYIDEGYMIDRYSKAFQTILTQGRSKQIPVITLSQRPALLSRFVFTEANYFSIFHLTDIKDEQNVQRFMREPIDSRLDRYHSRWFDVMQNKLFQIKPVPEKDKILERFALKMPKPKRFFFN